MKNRSMRLLSASSLAVLLLAACGHDGGGDAASTTATAPTEETTTTASEPAMEGTITVFAAASLTDAFEEVGTAFEDSNPGVTVEFNFAASSALREQILAGAPADVFASANTSNMDQVVEGGAATDPESFVENQLQIAVPSGNPAGITGLTDFANSDLLLGLCAEEVPCGQFGREARTNAGVTPAIDTNEPDVRSVLTKVEAGELDAGIVYITDVLSAGDAVDRIDIPAEENVIATYPIAALSDSGNAEAADAFVAFVLSDEGQAILGNYGFGAP